MPNVRKVDQLYMERVFFLKIIIGGHYVEMVNIVYN